MNNRRTVDMRVRTRPPHDQAPSAERTVRRPTKPRRLPQIDGLRGLALIGMLAWHAEIDWVKGGFARMTIFFVLAGYLAYGAFTRARDSGTEHPLRTYWIRRVRRLMPVTLVGVALALLVTAIVGSASARSSAGWDTVATLTSWINWRFIAAKHSYAELFESPTTFEHFWSLSLEEQCFLLTPLLALLAARCGGRRPAAVLLGTAAAISAIPLVWKQSPDTVYYGTHVRIGEFAAGAALAAILPLHATGRNERWIRLTSLISPLSLALLIGVMLTVPRNLPWLYRGGIGLMIIPALGILAGAVVGERVTTKVLSTTPLVKLGTAALSIYAIHWPIFVLLKEGIPALRGAPLQAVQLTVSIGAGLALFRWFEQPLMRSNDSPRTIRGIVAVGSVLIVAAWAMPTIDAAPTFEEQLAQQAERVRSVEAAAALKGPASSDGIITFASFGGSAALPLTFAGKSWFAEHTTELTPVPGDAQLGCGLLLDGVRSTIAVPEDPTSVLGGVSESTMVEPDQPCLEQPKLWPQRIREFQVETALYVGSTWDIGTWVFRDSNGERLVPGDQAFDSRLRAAMEERFDSMRAAGVDRLLVTNLNRPRSDIGQEAAREWKRRTTAYDAVLGAVTKSRPWITVIDQNAYTTGLGDETFAKYFPDGVHISADDGQPVWQELVGPALLGT